MSRLRIFDHDTPATPRVATSDRAEIAEHLKPLGVTFEQWTPSAHRRVLRSISQANRNSNASRCRRASAMSRPHAYRPWPSIR